jgi:hypothetical protein
MALTKLTTDLIDGTIVTSVNGSTGAVTLGTGTDWQATPKTADFTAVAGEGYFVDTTSATITVTLPNSPTTGDEISIVDYAGTAATYKILITSSNNIEGSSADKAIRTNRNSVTLVYSGTTKGWLATKPSLLESGVDPLVVDYLVVGGGGGGGGAVANGNGTGGGGAGGYRTSYNDGSVSALSLAISTNYTLTVGSGGAGGVGNSYGSNGANSVFYNITSSGGGGGAQRDSNGSSGGSGGGGGSYSGSAGSGNSGSYTPVEGYAGGNGTVPGNTNYRGGGGGGASESGISGATSGDGGNGLATSITGTSVTYAGGGGGGAYTSSSGGSGGAGGGGNGGAGSVSGSNGSTNTGGGAGGAGWAGSTAGNGGTGGSGVVILRYPSAYAVAIGSGLTGSTATVGPDKVTTFTAGTGNISFSL